MNSLSAVSLVRGIFQTWNKCSQRKYEGTHFITIKMILYTTRCYLKWILLYTAALLLLSHCFSFFTTEWLFYFHLLPILVSMAGSLENYASNYSYAQSHKWAAYFLSPALVFLLQLYLSYKANFKSSLLWSISDSSLNYTWDWINPLLFYAFQAPYIL